MITNTLKCYDLRKLRHETISSNLESGTFKKWKQIRREDFFIRCETTKHIGCLFVFSLLVKYLQLVDSSVSENKIHSFSGLLWRKEKTTEQ